MSESFGTKIIIVNDVQQVLAPEIFGGGPWVHICSLVRGFREYVVFRHLHTNKVFIEEFDPSGPYPFKRIEDDSEWSDLYHFVKEAGYLKASGEVKTGKQGLPGLVMTKHNE